MVAISSKTVEDRRRYLIKELMRHGYFKEEKKTDELTLSELESIHIQLKCGIGKQMSEQE